MSNREEDVKIATTLGRNGPYVKFKPANVQSDAETKFLFNKRKSSLIFTQLKMSLKYQKCKNLSNIAENCQHINDISHSILGHCV